MQRFKEFLTEVHYKDIYGKGFDDFMKKYKGEKFLYVQFTNHNSDKLERNPYESPNHSDPVGVYGYPISYVLKNPADIWYGRNAKFLRVLETTAKLSNQLFLNNMTESEFHNWMQKLLPAIGLVYRDSNVQEMIKRLRTTFKWKKYNGSTKFGKLLFDFVQIELTEPITDYDIKDVLGDWTVTLTADLKREIEEKFEIELKRFDVGDKISDRDVMFIIESQHHKGKIEGYQIRSGKEQTEILKKMGVSVLIDDSKTIASAVINDREPQQIVYLDRYSFKVLDVFNLYGKSDSIGVSPNYDRLLKKIMFMFLDRVHERPLKHGKQYKTITTTLKNGVEIVLETIEEDLQWRMDNLKMGQKKHKMYKTSDSHVISATFKFNGQEKKFTWSPTDRINKIVDNMEDRYQEIKEKI